MRKWISIIFLSTVCLCAFSAEKGKTDLDAYYKYKVDYVETQRLYRNGRQLTLVTFKLEWPVSLCYSTQPLLQNTLCRQVFGVEGCSLSEGMSSYFSSLGEQIDKMPDEKWLTVTYYKCTLKMLGWEEGKYLSFQIHKTRRDNQSKEESVNENKLYTYDLIKRKFLKRTDIISSKYNPTKLPAYYEWKLGIFTRRQEMFLADELSFFNVIQPDERLCSVCVIPYGVVISMGDEVYLDDGEPTLHALPMGYVKKTLAKPVKRVLESTPLVVKSHSAQSPVVMMAIDPAVGPDTTLVYDVVDQMAQFQKGAPSLKEYFSDELKYPEFETLTSKEGKVVVSFVVTRHGRIESPSVIVPCSPGIDREAVRAVMAMPQWTPASHNGVAVNSRVTLPLNFSLEK